MGLRVAARLGFRAVTLSAAQTGTRPRELDRSERRGLMAELKRLELHCDSIDLFIPPEHFTSSDTMERAIHAVQDALDLGSDLGASVLFVRLPHESLENPPSGGHSGPDGPGELESSPTRRHRPRRHGRLTALEEGARRFRSASGSTRLPGSPMAVIRLEGLILHGGLVGGVRLVGLDETGSRVSPCLPARIDIHAWRQAFDINAHGASLVIDARGWREPVEGVGEALQAWRA